MNFNKIKPCLLTISIFAITTTFGQGLSLDWVESGGSDGLIDESWGINVDTAGNVYVTGFFNGTVDFDPGSGTYELTSNGLKDVFLQKLDLNGNLVWVHQFGSDGSDWGYDVKIDANNDVYVTGTFRNTVDFDPGAGITSLTSNGFSDAFLVKLNSDGDFQWAVSYGQATNDYARSVNFDSTGNVLIAGYFQNTVDFDPGPGVFNLTTNGVTDACAWKLDSDGNFLWVQHFGGSVHDYAFSITSDSLDNVFMCGRFSSTVDFDPGPGVDSHTSVSGSIDVYIVKMASDGSYLWTRSVGGSGSDYPTSIDVDPTGNVYTYGHFRNTVDFDPGPGVLNLTAEGGDDCFIQKLNTDGDLVWIKSFGSAEIETAFGMVVNENSDVFVTGSYRLTTDFDPGAGVFELTSQGWDDVHVLQLDSMGNFIMCETFRGTGTDFGKSIDVMGDNLYISGLFNGTGDYDPGPNTTTLASVSMSDYFYGKYSICPSIGSIDVVTSCDSIIWIDGNTYLTDNSSATYTYQTNEGCDSIVTLNLTVLPTSNSTDIIIACDSIVWIDGLTYSTDNNSAFVTLTSSNGCDSIVSLDLTINPPIDLTVIQAGIVLTAQNVNAGSSYQWVDCNNGYTALSGETSQVYTASANGSYAVIIDENSCSDTSTCYTVTGVEIIENDFGSGLLIYPNPTDGNFSIDLGETYKTIAITITDLNGKLIQSITYNESQLLNLKLEEPAGIYFLRIESGSKKAVIRLIKE